MSLTLSSADLARIESSSELLLSPLNYARVDEWRRAVTRSLKALVGAEIAAFILPRVDAAPVFSEETSLERAGEYAVLAMPLFQTTPVAQRLVSFGVSNTRMV